MADNASTFQIDLLKALGLPTQYCKKAVITILPREPVTAELTFYVACDIGAPDLKKKYEIVATEKEAAN